MSKVEFNDQFEQRARLKAVEILLAALIEETSDIGALRARVDMMHGQVAESFNIEARKLAEPSRTDALHVADGFASATRDRIDKMMLGHLAGD